ncbi:MAG TPA: RagB/SusD family nutrient uptake outer membrane protein [Phnomibacter sp.]|nr:RagB/SusD family nutrient uptake outer membrane protein [Phnomibacter sp.]
MKSIKKFIYFIAAAAVLGSTSCTKTEDFLMLEDPDGVDARIWEEEPAIQYFLNETYQMIMPQFAYEYTTNNFNMHLVSDENYMSANDGFGKKVFNFNGFLSSDECRYIGTKYAGANFGENRYFDVAKCNLAIENIPLSKSLSTTSKRKLIGQFYALRGILYLGLTKYYGGVPLVLKPQNPSNLNLAGREKASVMFKQIVADFDSAIVNLDGVTWVDASERGKLTKAAAAALKAKALLWWASPLFNPTNDPAHPYDATRWATALKASEEAMAICTASGHMLLSDYSKIFQSEGAVNKEAIIVRSYSESQLKRFNGVEARCRPASEQGQPSDWYYPSTNMLDAYTMNDGTPISKSAAYDPVLFWKNRDPRFDATIAWNGCVWKLSSKTGRRQWTYNSAIANGINEGTRGVYVKRFSSPDLAAENVRSANDLGGSGMDWIELRLAEVILDYAEVANETGNLGLAKTLVQQIRKRAGIVAGSSNYGLDLATDQAQMRDLIMNERMVEFAFEGKRNDDLRRTRRMHLLTGMLGSIQVEPITTAEKTNLEKPIDPLVPTGLLQRDTINFNSAASVKAHFKYPYKVVYPTGNGAFSMPQNYYFFSLSNQFLNSTPLLQQTIGWDGGTFDPL